MNGEEWRQFRATQYSVSTLGRIRNDRTGQLLQPTIQRRKGGKITGRRVRFGTRAQPTNHRVGCMVLETFRGSCPLGKECCHDNGDPTDDKLSNLYWGTHLENMRDAVRHGRLGDVTAKGSAHVNAKLTDTQVRQSRELRQQGLSVAKIVTRLGLPVTESTLWRAIHGSRYASA